jgi:hypothetical protein
MAEGTGRWLVLLSRMPSEPARHRIALWREFRRSGAVPLGQSAWAVPHLPAVEPLLVKARSLTDAAGGDLLVLAAAGWDETSAERLDELYAAAREDDWAEFAADCGKYLAEIDKEEAIGKFTLAELEEEEQSLARLRRWYRDLRARDLLGTPAAGEGSRRLKQCETRFDAYAERVYVAVREPAPRTGRRPTGRTNRRS